MRVVVNKYLIGRHFVGIALWPFIVVKENHERIHLRQQAELLVLPFYLIYLLEYIVRVIQYRNSQLAYRNISFEREAYENEDDLDYLKKRKLWSFMKYW